MSIGFKAAAVLAIGALAIISQRTWAADRMVQLQKPSKIGRNLQAMPLIVSPVDEAERSINLALSHLDLAVKKSAQECIDGHNDRSYERNVTATMQGPRFLSFKIVDITSCGGPHPDASTAAIVYDLTTGAPVNWASLLPVTLAGKQSLVEESDGTKMVNLTSPTLFALYLTGYRPRSGDPKKDAEDEDCRSLVAHGGSDEDLPAKTPSMEAWLDAKQDGLVIYGNMLAHVVAACQDEVTIPASALRVLGAQPILSQAVDEAHAAEVKQQ